MPAPIPDRIYGPGHYRLGSFHRGRVVYDTLGRRLKVLAQRDGSTLVRRAGSPKTIQGRTFTPPETITLSTGTAVRLRKEGQHS